MNTPTGYSALDLVGFTDRGDYSSSETYVKNDLVHYLGDIWRVKLDDITGQTPSEGTYYTIFIEGIPDKAYKTDDTTENTLASDDVLPFYDTSASAKRKMPVQKFAEQLISNPNLLDNPWFTVNQRGQSSYSYSGGSYNYTVDRWYNNYPDGVVTVGNGVTLNNYKWFCQPLDADIVDLLDGKTVTASVMLSDGTIISGTEVFHADNAITYVQIKSGENAFIRTSNQHNMLVFEVVNFAPSQGEDLTIRAVKLELGSVSTLAMDTAPNYATELLKCQRYFVDMGGIQVIFASSEQGTRVFSNTIRWPVNMRANPSISVYEENSYAAVIQNVKTYNLTQFNSTFEFSSITTQGCSCTRKANVADTDMLGKQLGIIHMVASADL